MEYVAAPLEWAFGLCPLREPGQELLSLEWVCGVAHALIDRAEAEGDDGHVSPVLHWAHRLVILQSRAGDWPAEVNARDGAAIGEERTKAPARLLDRLGDVLGSSEFDHAVERAKDVS